MLSALLERRTKHRKAEERDHEAEFDRLAQIVADGKELTEDDIENFISMELDPTPICPKHEKHAAEIIGLNTTNGVKRVRCRCTTCGECWLQDAPRREIEPGKITIEQLKERAELLTNRKAWRETAKEIPKLEKELQAYVEEVDAINQKLEKLMNDRQMAEQRKSEVMQKLHHARAAEQKLLSTGTVTMEEHELTNRRGKIVRRIQAIRQEVWGQSQIGNFDMPETGTAGSRYVSGDREIERLRASDKPADRERLKKLVSRKSQIKKREIDPLVDEYHMLEGQLEHVNAQIEQLQKAKLK